MRKTSIIFICISITFLMMVQSFFLVTYLNTHKNEVRTEFAEHFDQNSYIDLSISDYQKNTKVITWLEKDEIMINDYFFDILKVEKIKGDKLRLYVFCDVKDVSISDLLCKEHGLKQKAAKKSKRNTISNLLKLKTSLPKVSTWLFTCNDVKYTTNSSALIAGFQSPVEHPPAV